MKHYRDIRNTVIHFECHAGDSIVSESRIAYALPEAVKRVTVVQTHLKDTPPEGAKYLEEML